jgi:heterodisulfide reductase subunit C
MLSLRQLILAQANQDIRRCQACLDCEAPGAANTDIPLGTLVQMALLNDDEVLDCRTLWSDEVLAAARSACKKGLNLEAVLLALRAEAGRRGSLEAHVRPAR